MLRRFLFLSVGGLALLVVLAAPGQLHAQRTHGGMHPGMHGGFHHGGFHHGGFGRPFGPGPRIFDPRFNRFGFGRFDRFEDRFERRFGFDPRFNRGFFDPRFSPGFFPGFFRPF